MDKEKLRKIDELVAEKVMGWHRKVLPGGGGGGGFTAYVDEEGKIQKFSEHPPINFCSCEVFSPSTDISDAWRVVEKLRESHIFQFGDAWDENDKKIYSANFQYNDSYTWQNYEAWAETAPLTICLAALKTVGIEIEMEELINE